MQENQEIYYNPETDNKMPVSIKILIGFATIVGLSLIILGISQF